MKKAIIAALAAIAIGAICISLVWAFGSDGKGSIPATEEASALVSGSEAGQPDTSTVPFEGISLNPSSGQASPGQQMMVTVEANLAGYGIRGCEMELAFDPGALQLSKVEPGEMFGENPLVGIEEIDNEAGTLNYVLAMKGTDTVPSSAGVMAVLEFDVREPVQKGSCALTLTTVNLTDEGFKEISDFPIRSGTTQIE